MSDEDHTEGEEEHRPNLVLLTFPDEPETEDVEQYVEKTAGDITPAEKVEFLQYIRQGYDRQEAAGALGYRARPWRALTSSKSPHYDEEFANSYAEACGAPETKLHFLERLRAETLRRGLTDSDRLLEKLMLVHDPDWQVLRQKDVNVNIHAVIQQHFKDLPTDLLEQLLAALDAQAEGQQTIEDAEYRELPPVSDDADGH